MTNVRGRQPFLCLVNAIIIVSIAIISGDSLGETGKLAGADLSLAESLFREHGIRLDESLEIVDAETFSIPLNAEARRTKGVEAEVTQVWCGQSYKGLPVFSGRIAYRFVKDLVSSKPTTVELTGDRLDPAELDISTLPAVSEREAIDLFLEQSSLANRHYIQPGPNITATLGIRNKMGGIGRVEPVWILVWKVVHRDRYPLAYFDAQTGTLYSFDDGIRY